MPHLLRRSIVIGLGGTGLEAILKVKLKFWQVFGRGSVSGNGQVELPEGMRGIRFLAFDTTEPKTILSESGAEVGLKPGEFVRLQVHDPSILLRQNREIRDWYPENVPARAIFAGAGQIRALGRLALFANSDTVHHAIEKAFSDVRGFEIDQDAGDFDYPTRNILVYVVGSLAGGTGSGTFLDCGFQARKRMGNLDTSVAILLLPDVFTTLPASNNVEPNAYGALKELDHFSEVTPPFQTYLFNGERIEYRPPFDIIHLVNNCNLDNVLYNDVSHMTEVIGTGIYVSSGTAGQRAADIWDNLKGQITAQGYWDGKKPLYSSFGVSELLYDGDRYSEIAAGEVALDLIAGAFRARLDADTSQDVERFVDSSQLREDTGDYIIDALWPLHQWKSRFGIPQEFTKAQILQAYQRRMAFVETTKADIKSAIEDSAPVVKETREAALDQHVGELIRKPGGVNQAREFLRQLSSRIASYSALMEEEMSEYRGALTMAETEAARLESIGRKMTEKFFSPSKTQVEQHLRLYAPAIDRIVLNTAQVERRQAASSFFNVFTIALNQWIQSLEGFAENISTVDARISQRVANARMSRRRIRPFVLDVEAMIPDRSQLQISPGSFLEWLEQTKQDGIVWMINRTTEQIEEALLQYARTNPAVTEIRNRSIENVLLDLPEEQKWDYIASLYQMAIPMWSYDREYLGGSRQVTNILLFGVANSNDTFLDVAGLREHLPHEATVYEPDVVDTGDARRIICLNTNAALPAFAIRYIKHKYRDPFLDDNRPFTYHIHKDWDQDLKDLIPPTESEEERLLWALALSEPYGLVKRVGHFYEVRSEKKGERTRDFWIRLEQGRANARQKFLQNPEITAEIRDKIDEINRTLGNKQVAERLRDYRKTLKDSVKSGDSRTGDFRPVVEQELEDIDRFLDDIAE